MLMRTIQLTAYDDMEKIKSLITDEREKSEIKIEEKLELNVEKHLALTQ